MTSEHVLPDPVREKVLLSSLTSFGIGGPARYLVDAATGDAVRDALLFARREGLRWMVIGDGTNILIDDDGFDGLVIRMAGGTVEVADSTVTSGAGVPLMEVIQTCVSRGFAGMESLAGVPGSLGGAVRGNAGAFGTVMGDIVETVTAMDSTSLEVRTFPREQCGFGYRSSLFKEDRRLIVLAASMSLATSDPAVMRVKVEETLSRRSGSHQREKSAGSFFVNPLVSDVSLVRLFEAERGIVCRNCRIPAGWLIEQAGLRGVQVGDARVSETHGNYLINSGAATAADVKRLADLVKHRVRERFGIDLEEEIDYLGP